MILGVRACISLSGIRSRTRQTHRTPESWELETELALVTQAAKLVEEGVRPTATYPVIAALASQGFSAKRCCRILRQEGKMRLAK
jgi:hypothetical protein